MTGAAAELTGKSVADLGRLVQSHKVSPVEITTAFLSRASALDNKLNTFISIFGERALDNAHHAEREVMAGRYRGPLHGIPFAPKDILATKGLLTTNGSSVTAKWVPDYESTVTQRLGHAGAILFGKLSLAEFAVGTSPAFRTPRNPWALDHITGGSSSGSAAALAADLTPFSIGTDTGGSIRYPSALCGTVGLKPTYGRVSRFGVTTLSWSLDHVGPMARSAADVAIVLQAIAGQDPNDLTSSHAKVPNYAPGLPRGLKGFRVGVPTNYFFEGANPEVERCVRGCDRRTIGSRCTASRRHYPTCEPCRGGWLGRPQRRGSVIPRASTDGVRPSFRPPNSWPVRSRTALNSCGLSKGPAPAHDPYRRNERSVHALRRHCRSDQPAVRRTKRLE